MPNALLELPARFFLPPLVFQCCALLNNGKNPPLWRAGPVLQSSEVCSSSVQWCLYMAAA